MKIFSNMGVINLTHIYYVGNITQTKFRGDNILNSLNKHLEHSIPDLIFYHAKSFHLRINLLPFMIP